MKKVQLILTSSLAVISLTLAACGSGDAQSSQQISKQNGSASTDNATSKQACNNKLIFATHANKNSDTQVLGCGTIVKILPDDLKGSKHQKFIVRLDTPSQYKNQQLTILIAHNIDLAPRAEPVKKGTRISFFGEYEYNNKGGVVHWTHHDPAGRHQDGWLEVAGKRFG